MTMREVNDGVAFRLVLTPLSSGLELWIESEFGGGVEIMCDSVVPPDPEGSGVSLRLCC